MKKKSIKTIFLFCVVLLPIILTVFQVFEFYPRGYIIKGDDTHFHLTRILGLANSLKYNNYPFFINNAFLNGLGYASNWFYPDLFILPMSVMMNLGIHLIHFVKSFYIALSIGTFLMTYYCTNSITKNKSISYVAAIIYTFCHYRSVDLYWRFALGESIAFLFLPLVFLGCYELFLRDEKKWYLLTFGFLGMLYSHLLSTLLCFLMVIAFALLNFKKLIDNKYKMLFLIVAGTITLLIGSFQIFPMFEQLLSNTFKLTTFTFRTPSQQSFSISQLLSSIFLIGPFTPQVKEANYGIGFVFLFFVSIRLFIKRKENANIKFGDILCIASLFLVIMTTSVFPWDRFHLLDTIQFPWRLNMFSSLFLSISSSIYLVVFSQKLNLPFRIFGFIMILILITLNNNILASNFLKSNNDEWSFFTGNLTSHEQIWRLEIGGGQEYLPDIIDYQKIKYQIENKEPLIQASNSIVSYIDSHNTVHYKFSGLTNNTKIEFPRIWYLGYKTFLNGIPIPNQMSNNGFVEVDLCDVRSGELTLIYKATNIQKYSLIVSIFSSLLFALLLLIMHNKEQKNKIYICSNNKSVK